MAKAKPGAKAKTGAKAKSGANAKSGSKATTSARAVASAPGAGVPLAQPCDFCVVLTLSPDAQPEAALRALQRNARANQGALSAPLAGTDPEVARAVVQASKKWAKNDTITIGFMNGTASDRDFVEKVCREWFDGVETDLQLDFGRSPGGANVRIEFVPNGPNQSAIGLDAESPQFAGKSTMTLGFIPSSSNLPEKEKRRLTLHEFGHVLGFLHEHQRSDRPFTLNMQVLRNTFGVSPNFWNDDQINFNITNTFQLDSSNFLTTEFDHNSIMAYFIPAAAASDGIGTPINNDLSDDDRKMLKLVYGKGNGQTQVTPLSKKDLPLGATSPTQVSLKAGQVQPLTLTIPKARMYQIRTVGDKHTDLEVFGPDNDSASIGRGVLDLESFNMVANLFLEPGAYLVKAALKSQTESGDFGVTAKLLS